MVAIVSIQFGSLQFALQRLEVKKLGVIVILSIQYGSLQFALQRLEVKKLGVVVILYNPAHYGLQYYDASGPQLLQQISGRPFQELLFYSWELLSRA